MTLIRTFFAVTAVAVFLLTGYELHDRYSLAPLELIVDPVSKADHLSRQGRAVEAKWLADFVIDHPHLGDQERATRLSLEAASRVDDLREQMLRFAGGAVTGEPNDFLSLLGSLSVDLFVIGDVRDLAVQSWKQMRYGTGDEIVLALSAVGLISTLAPQLDWAPALIKSLVRTDAMNAKFIQVISTASHKAVQTGDFHRLRVIVEDVGNAAMRLGPGPLQGVLPAVETANDLTKLAHGAKVDARSAYILASLTGTQGLRRLKKDGRNIGYLVGSIKLGSRAAKIAKKITGTLSTRWLLVFFGVSIVTIWLATRARWRRSKRWARRVERIEPKLNPEVNSDLDHSPLDVEQWQLSAPIQKRRYFVNIG